MFSRKIYASLSPNYSNYVQTVDSQIRCVSERPKDSDVPPAKDFDKLDADEQLDTGAKSANTDRDFQKSNLNWLKRSRNEDRAWDIYGPMERSKAYQWEGITTPPETQLASGRKKSKKWIAWLMIFCFKSITY